MGYVNDAYKDEIYKNSKWEPYAREYEKKFAANLYKSDFVKGAARDALVRLSTVLNAYYAAKDNAGVIDAAKVTMTTGKLTTETLESVKQFNQAAALISGDKPKPTAVLEEALLADGLKRDSAGQIGNAVDLLGADATEEQIAAAHDVNKKNIGDVISEDGNLREMMTMLYNGTFINGGNDSEGIAKSHSLKNMLANITEADVSRMHVLGTAAGNDIASQFNMDFDMLGAFSGVRKDGGDMLDAKAITLNMRQQTEKKKGIKNWFTRPISALYRAAKNGLAYTFKRESKPADTKGHGEQYYNDLGLQLSAREAAFGKNHVGELMWREGSAWGKYSDSMAGSGQVQVMGTSGTTLRMMAAMKFLGAKPEELLHFRLALMAWMVSAEDHSIYEILKGSHLMGVKGYENIDDAIEMYQTIDPLTSTEIRENFAPDKMFPHEKIYIELLEEIAEERGQREFAKTQAIFGEGKTPQDYEKYLTDEYTKKHPDWTAAQVKEKVDKEMTDYLQYLSLEKEKEAIKKIQEVKDFFLDDFNILPLAPDEIEQEIVELEARIVEDRDTVDTLTAAMADDQLPAAQAWLEEDEEKLVAYKKYKEVMDLILIGQSGKLTIDNMGDDLALDDRLDEIELALYEKGEDFKDKWKKEDFVKYYGLHRIAPGNAKKTGTQEEQDKNSASLFSAQDLARNIYTSGAFQTMRIGSMLGTSASSVAFSYVLNREEGEAAFNHQTEGDKSNPELLKKIESAIRISARIAQDSFIESKRKTDESTADTMAALSDTYKADEEDAKQDAMEATDFYSGKVYRGGRKGIFSNGGYTTGALTSTSKSVDVAMKFYDDSKKGFMNLTHDAVLQRITLNGLSALDVSNHSVYGYEEEVLIPIGTKLEVSRSMHEAVVKGDKGNMKVVDASAKTIAELKANPEEDQRVINLVDLKEVSSKHQTDRKKINRTRRNRLTERQKLLAKEQKFKKQG